MKVGTTKKIIDVSQYNTIESWGRIKNDCDGVIIRAGFRGYGKTGTLVEDKQYRKNMEGAIGQNIPVGVYWVSQATSEAEAKEEARFLKGLLAPYKITYPVYLDSEYGEPSGKGRADGLPKAQRTAFGLTFCAELKGYGYTPGLYTANGWFDRDWIDGPAFQRAGYSIWIARYGNVPPTVKNHDAWQYTSTGRVDGVSGNVDISVFLTDYETKTNRDKVGISFGLAEKTLDYLEAYQYGEDLLRKLAGAK